MPFHRGETWGPGRSLRRAELDQCAFSREGMTRWGEDTRQGVTAEMPVSDQDQGSALGRFGLGREP